MSKQHKRTNSKRTTKNRKIFGQWLFFIAIGLFLLLIVRFSYIAIFKDVKNVNLKQRTEQLYTQKKVIHAKRGKIYDSSDDVLAGNTETYSVYAILDHSDKTASGKPLYVTNKKKTAKVLSKYLSISEAKAMKIMTPSKSGTFQVEFGSAGNDISVDTKEKIQAQHLTGINFTATATREYSYDNFASQLIGLAQPKTNSKTGETKLIGELGIEQVFNKQLSGTNGVKKAKEDNSGYQISNTEQTPKKAKNGDNVYTTFNSQLQTLLESKVEAAQKSAKGQFFNAVVMNAKTGAIVAATQRPNYESSSDPSWSNALTQVAYEPGSTMKVFTLSAAIDSGNFNANGVYKSGTYELGGGEVTDWDKAGWGYITFKQAFERSSNVGMAHLEQNMGSSTWKKYLHKFGFLQKVNVVGTSNETSGSSPFKGALEQANTAFGQGITVNVMQMMQAFSAVANNGKMLKPYFIRKIVDPNTNKTVKSYGKKVVGNPISASTAKKVRKLMQGVVYASDGTGSKYKIKGYRIAGKTGTAEYSSGTSGYEKGTNAYIYSFVGMAPAKNPEYVMYVTIKKPQNTSTPAETYLASVFDPVMKQALDDAKSAKQKNAGTVTVKNVVGQQTSTAQSTLSGQGMTVVVIGNGNKVMSQSIGKGTTVLANNKIFIVTSGKTSMPDVSGWSSADVNKFAKLTKLNLTISGSGYATSQSIKAGSQLQSGQQLQVKFKQK
ncbi:penicillin-binding transpeptidase domain-containing protein [Paucilactobacillus suebicus]|uniref:Penicillin binding protein 2B n=1 Tax=Paucilactobacillus suebicus DSM 5007 = KCTC 3549 TaxID=1423807 RepID=A0A0R1W4X2_9LACO|nr:penicillin-binding transpeptidase domain-containing protein [Paucilactobacillus suebicus]KRM12562.1 penicillin binding protein 2B [Paucilactobacillus suebicus DSM 5007 = KCTC 3549]